jgi:CheY-like chemotaxis protein
MVSKPKKKILVIEDNIDNVDLYLYMFEKEYQVFAAYTGRDGLEKIYSEKPDIIILDLVLPDISGFEIAKDVRSNEEFKNTPIIAISVYNMNDEMQKALDAGCDEYIRKPFEVEHLIKLVKKLVK